MRLIQNKRTHISTFHCEVVLKRHLFMG